MKATIYSQSQIEALIENIAKHLEYSDQYYLEFTIGKEELDLVRGLDENNDPESDPINLYNNIADQLAFEYCAHTRKTLYRAIRERHGSKFEIVFNENN